MRRPTAPTVSVPESDSVPESVPVPGIGLGLGVDEEAISEHAGRVGMPADEITSIDATVVVRDDPAEASADAA